MSVLRLKFQRLIKRLGGRDSRMVNLKVRTVYLVPQNMVFLTPLFFSRDVNCLLRVCNF
jgi:hypothetical protein